MYIIVITYIDLCNVFFSIFSYFFFFVKYIYKNKLILEWKKNNTMWNINKNIYIGYPTIKVSVIYKIIVNIEIQFNTSTRF